MDTRKQINRAFQAACRIASKHPDWRVRSAIEGMQGHFEGYAEPGYSDPECCVIMTGNWNEITEYNGNERIVISSLPAQLLRRLEKLGVECEWSDEWSECSDCGKLFRTEADSMCWEPSYRWRGECELLCSECAEEEEEEAEGEEEEAS